MRQDGTLYYLLMDHLGSTSITTDASGVRIAELRYDPWGEVRYAWGSQVTDYTYTGQRSEVGPFELMYYRARWYDPVLGRFARADTIVPGVGDVLAWDRYAYAYNNPLYYTDPSGHEPETDDDVPPVTYDEEHGLCINTGDYIYCSGTIESNIDWINWNTIVVLDEYGDEIGDVIGTLDIILDIGEDLDGLPYNTFDLPWTFGFGLDAIVQGLEDHSRDDITGWQKLGRAGLAGAEGFGVDLLSKGFGTSFGLSGATACLPTGNPLVVLVGFGAGYIAGYATTNVVASRFVDQKVNPTLFTILNLGSP